MTSAAMFIKHVHGRNEYACLLPHAHVACRIVHVTIYTACKQHGSTQSHDHTHRNNGANICLPFSKLPQTHAAQCIHMYTCNPLHTHISFRLQLYIHINSCKHIDLIIDKEKISNNIAFLEIRKDKSIHLSSIVALICSATLKLICTVLLTVSDV